MFSVRRQSWSWSANPRLAKTEVLYSGLKESADPMQDKRKRQRGDLVLAVLIATSFMTCCHATKNKQTAPQAIFSAEKIYQEWGCGTCHGENGAGSSQGPPLIGLVEHWQREALVRYLNNPAAMRATDQRLLLLTKSYYPISMPALEGLDSTQIGLLVDHLLQRR